MSWLAPALCCFGIALALASCAHSGSPTFTEEQLPVAVALSKEKALRELPLAATERQFIFDNAPTEVLYVRFPKPRQTLGWTLPTGAQVRALWRIHENSWSEELALRRFTVEKIDPD